MVTTSINWDAFEDEFTRFLRNGDVLTVAERNVTTDSDDTFSGDDSTVSFLINRNNVKNIRTISVGAAEQSFGADYTYDLDYDDGGTKKTRITFTSAPATGTDNITLSYDYGSDNIFPGYSKTKLKQNQVPRANWEWISSRTEDIELGGGAQRTVAQLTIVVLGKTRDDVRRILENIRLLVLNNKKNFYYAKYIRLNGTGPVIPFDDGSQTVVQTNVDVDVYFDVEV